MSHLKRIVAEWEQVKYKKSIRKKDMKTNFNIASGMLSATIYAWSSIENSI